RPSRRRRFVVQFVDKLLRGGRESRTSATGEGASMRNFFAAMVVCTAVAVALPALASPGDGRQATVHRVKQVSAGALAFFGDCVDPVNQPVGAVCHETFVILFRETHVVDGGSNAPSPAPWGFYATDYTMTFVAPGTDPVISDQVEGFVLDPALASSDREHLSTASVAAQVPMGDGSTFDFQGTWTASSDRLLYGNDGPNAGELRHFVDK